jgi:hypothetical protein
MVRGKTKTKKVERSLSHGELQDVRGLKQDAEATLRHIEENPGTARSETVNKAGLKKQIDYYDQVIHDGMPKTPRSGVQKDALAKEAKELAEKMKEGMPTRAEMDHPSKNPGAIRKHIQWAQRNDDNVRRYREIMRRLDPQDPTSSDVERLRRAK